MKLTLILTACSLAISASTVFGQAFQTEPDHAEHALAVPGVATAREATLAGPHGGSLKQTNNLQIETIVSQGGLQMFVYDRAGLPASLERARGAVSVRVAGNAKRYRYDLLPDGKGSLTAPVNLSRLAGRQIEVDVQLVGMSAWDGNIVSFTEVASVPASEQQLAAAAIAHQKITVTTATQADAAAMAAQKVCPVMDEPLGGMGTPIKVMVGDKPIYLCCKGCVKKIQADPAKYLAMVHGDEKGSRPAGESGSVAAGPETVREGVFKVTPADAPFIAAQQKCPVMDEPLDAMGGPCKVNAAGKAIYICCPGCAKKIAAEPAKWLAILKSQGVEAPVIR